MFVATTHPPYIQHYITCTLPNVNIVVPWFMSEPDCVLQDEQRFLLLLVNLVLVYQRFTSLVLQKKQSRSAAMAACALPTTPQLHRVAEC